MAQAGTASAEIERTLRLQRDDVERRIARFRVWFFAVVAVSGLPMGVVARLRGQPIASLAPFLFFSAATLIAFAMRRAVDRLGARNWLIYVTVVLDLVIMLSPGAVFGHFDEGMRAQMVVFGSHLSGAGAMLVLFVNVLRMNARAAVVGAIAAMGVVLAVLLPIEGFVPPLPGVLMGIGLTAVIGVGAARQARATLERFARTRLLERYLPAGALERVLAEDPDAALALGGAQVDVTVLAADLRGFTQLSEALPPAEVVRQLNAYHGRMVEQLDAHRGVLDKFIGDGILAVFGMPTPGAAPSKDVGAADAVGCARAMLRALEELNVERGREGLAPLAMGIGVHSGPVVAGNIGAPGRRLEFTIIGDTVNTAARLEGLTKEAGSAALISSSTAERMAKQGLREGPPMAVRGRREPIRVFTLDPGQNN